MSSKKKADDTNKYKIAGLSRSAVATGRALDAKKCTIHWREADVDRRLKLKRDKPSGQQSDKAAFRAPKIGSLTAKCFESFPKMCSHRGRGA